MQNVLNIKFQLEAQAKLEFSDAQRQKNDAEQILNEMKQKLEEYIADMRNAQKTEGLDVRALAICKKTIEIQENMIEEQKNRLFVLTAKLDRAREKLNEVMQDRKIHEKMKENQFEIFKKEVNHNEMKEIDELVSYQHNVSKE